MRESQVHALVRSRLTHVGGGAAVLLFRGTHRAATADMLHRVTGFPESTSSFTAGWRGAAASLSDLATIGTTPLGVLLALGDPDLDASLPVRGVLEGTVACCEISNTKPVGRDVDCQNEVTLVSAAFGEAERPVLGRVPDRGWEHGA